MRFNLSAVKACYQARKHGGTGRYIEIDLRGFLRGYSLFVPLQAQTPQRLFRFKGRRPVTTDSSATLKPWTIHMQYPTTSDDGKNITAYCMYQVDAVDIPAAYRQFDEAFAGRAGYKAGYILPGHHMTPAGAQRSGK